jgi:hypothetical protein
MPKSLQPHVYVLIQPVLGFVILEQSLKGREGPLEDKRLHHDTYTSIEASYT